MSVIHEQIQYWHDIDYSKISDDAYRRTHDMDCVLTDGDLNADMMISLWLPLRYVLMEMKSERWNALNKNNLKNNPQFLEELAAHLNEFIPDQTYRDKLETLFTLGRTRANVMILPFRFWNTARGGQPYFDYLPHFLYDLLSTNQPVFLNAVQEWIQREHLEMFFDGDLTKEHIRNLCGTKNVFSHHPSNINVMTLLDNYIDIIQERQKYFQ